jgi:hypothetical protein
MNMRFHYERYLLGIVEEGYASAVCLRATNSTFIRFDPQFLACGGPSLCGDHLINCSAAELVAARRYRLVAGGRFFNRRGRPPTLFVRGTGALICATLDFLRETPLNPTWSAFCGRRHLAPRCRVSDS